MPQITISKFLDINEEKNNILKIRRITGLIGLDNKLLSSEINRPGMALFSYFENFASDRIQIFGLGEGGYVNKLDSENNTSVFNEIFNYNIPVCVFTNNIVPPDSFIEAATSTQTPILVSNLKTDSFIRSVSGLLEYEFAESKTVHGVFIEVFGVGVLLKGNSGVGKSEATLELLSRGHRLIADDSVTLKKLNDDLIIGQKNKMLNHYMEVRGVGIVDISRLSGMSAVRDRKRLDLIIELAYWDEETELKHDRTGLNDKTEKFLDVDISYLKIAIRPGRNISILIETAAKNYRLKTMGYHSAKEFDKQFIEFMQKGSKE